MRPIPAPGTPTSSRAGGTSLALVCHGPTGSQRIALTFDDGPSEWADPLLDIPATHSVHATFFVVGSYVQERADLVRRMHDAGHELGNHTFDHVDAAHEREDDVLRDQIARTSEAIEAATGTGPALMRPPYGKDVCRVARLAGGRGLAPTVLWSVQAWDWDGETGATWIRERVLEDVHPGAIVLLHDGAPPYDSSSRQATVEAVAGLVPELLGRGFEPVTVSELLDL